MRPISFLLPLILMAAKPADQLIKTVQVPASAIPKDIKYSGKIINSVKYTDAGGEHLVITTETLSGTYLKDDMDTQKAEIHAWNYDLKPGHQLLWKVADLSECPIVDVTAKYVPRTFAVTDLDHNGIAEVWLMYKTACRGDVSPSTMKIVMYEGQKKYAVRGTSRVALGKGESEGGAYALDAAFKAAPQPFRQYATSLWKKNINEVWE